jgi:NAD(P)-dependent dehydrogenase (short-subunit alcohol dehydrogenase family)
MLTRIFCCCRRRGDARRAEGLRGPVATEGLVVEEDIARDYDAALTKLWGGPPPKHFPAAFSEWPSKYPSGAGRVALVTGGGAGIGLYISMLLSRLGYTVIIPLRAGLEHEAAGARRAIEARVGAGAELLFPPAPLDLASFASVRAFAASVREMLDARNGGHGSGSLALLCLNAGRGGATGDPRELTAAPDSHESIMQVNALSHALLTAELLPLLQRHSRSNGNPARVVSQSSGARVFWKGTAADVHRRLTSDLDAAVDAAAGTYDAFNQYSLSKAACCIFTAGLNAAQARSGSAAVLALATDPGFCSTGVNIQHNLGHSHLGAPDGVLATSTMHDLAGAG